MIFKRKFLLIFIAIYHCSVLADSSGFPGLHQVLLKQLNNQDYFKNARCDQIANYILNENGLPALTKASPVNGLRGRVDRTGENLVPPVFVDNITIPHAAADTMSVNVTAAGNEQAWNLTIDRKIYYTDKNNVTKQASLTTQYHFKSADRKKWSCDFVDLDFTVARSSGRPYLSKKFDLNACLDMFTTSPPASDFKSAPDPMGAENMLRHDCAFGVHYSQEAKRASR